MVEHLFYELQMLEMSASLLGIGLFGKDPVKHSLLESFATHSRSLVYFLYPPEKIRNDDVLASHYIKDGIIWESVRPKKPTSLEIVHWRVGKEIAHLTYERNKFTEESRAWGFIEIAKDILKVFDVLLVNKKEINYGRFLDEYQTATSFPISINLNGNRTEIIIPRLTRN